jgi:GR25 family glycosyltransferase involved in LPS biosynthesis
MKKLVISLLRRPDRKREFQKNNLVDYEYIKAFDGSNEIFRHCKGRDGWLEPFKKRPLLQNEVACFLSHIKAWEKVVELNEPCIVMEDDAIINDTWDEDLYESFKYDFVYLQRNENEPNLVSPADHEKLEIPSYPYNMTAYKLTPFAAKYLLSQVNYEDMIPVDEFLPEILNKHFLRIAALKIDACNQLPREMGDIEQSKPFRNYKIHAMTCGTDRKKCEKLNTSAKLHGVEIENIGTNVVWKGTDMSFMGGGMKINLMKKRLETMYEDDIVVFTDAYDVFYADNLDTILERYEDFGKQIVFSGELYCYPDSSLAEQFPAAPTEFKYINSGTYVGRVSELKKLFNNYEIADDDDDQLYVHKCFLTGFFDIAIDYECYIFQTNYNATQKLGEQLNNPDTQCCPCIYHGNGGESAAPKFESLYNEFYPKTSAMFIPHYNRVKYLTDDMIVVPFMTQTQCEDLIDIADKHGGWDSLGYDKFPAKEIRLRQMDSDLQTDLFIKLEKHWEEHIVPLVESYWKPLQMYGLRDAFVMRYSMDTQIKLALHHDASLVTGSVKLNDDYEGADLLYPRQGISNRDIPVGNILLFAGAVTHGHECLPLKAGVKYSLTIWSCRYIGDTI